MPDPNEVVIERASKKQQAKIEELEKIVRALILAIKNTEEELGEPLMPEGTYYGIKFADE